MNLVVNLFVSYLLCLSFVPADASLNNPSQPSIYYPKGRDRPHEYKIIKDEIKYSGWRKVIRRSVLSPTRPHVDEEQIIDFDIIDQTHVTATDKLTRSGAVIIFAWNSTSKTATIVREYMPGCHRILSGLAAGIVEGDKHSCEEGVGDSTDLVAARYELEEEW